MVVYSAKHLDTIAQMSLNRVELLLNAWIDRYKSLLNKACKNFNLNCLKGVSDLYNKKLIKLSKPSMFHISEFLVPLEKIKERKSIGKLCLYTDSYKGRQE